MYSPERRYAEDAALVLQSMGMTPAFGRLLGYLLICDPPEQSSAQLAEALGLSKGSISTGARVLEQAGLVRRVVAPGVRGNVYEMTDDAMLRAATVNEQYRRFGQLMQRGIDVIGDERAPRAARLRRTRDFFAFLDRELPKLVERFHREYEAGNTREGTDE